jgi:hypothetical protein
LQLDIDRRTEICSEEDFLFAPTLLYAAWPGKKGKGMG